MQALWKAAELAADWLPIVSIGLLIVLLSGWASWKGLGFARGIEQAAASAGVDAAVVLSRRKSAASFDGKGS